MSLFRKGLGSSLINSRMIHLVRRHAPVWFKYLVLSVASRFISKRKVYPTRRGVRFRLLREHHCSWIAFEKDYESGCSDLIEGFLEPGDTGIDVGANFGWYSILMAKCGCRQVLAFEPNSRTFEVLRANIALNGFDEVIRARPAALGNQEGTGFLVLPIDGNSSLGQLRDSDEIVNRQTTVKIKTLDSESGEHAGAVAYLKIDAEGSEYDILCGAKSLLSHASPPVIQFEINARALHLRGTSEKAVANFLASLEFEILRPGKGLRYDPETRNPLKDGIWMAVPPGKFGERFRKKCLIGSAG